ncbi:hypothetical protein DFH06DRAFT_1065707 [Mycena polygramma]|nr:hypothetical protein DFH06DRAFT_1065707 [Mycena polygramma]
MLVSPRLASISLAAGSSANHLSLLTTLGVKYPDLIELDTRGGPSIYWDSRTSQIILALLSNLKRLQSFGISNVNSAILEHVARLPTLKSLVINEFVSFGSFSQRNGHNAHFTSLEELQLWRTTPDVGAAMVETIANHALVSLDFAFQSDYPTSETTARLYSAIAANGSYATLDCLRVEDEWAYYSQAETPEEFAFDSYVVGSRALRTLFAFTNLATVILKPFYGFAFDVNDKVVSEMARAWCRVEELRLARSHDLHAFAFGTGITLRGVRAIAAHCTHLRILELNFDATEIPPPVETVPQTRLTELNAHCSRISSPTAVSAFLSATFPQLKRVFSSCLMGPPRSAVGRWRKVERLLRGSTSLSRFESSTDEEFTDTDDMYSD